MVNVRARQMQLVIALLTCAGLAPAADEAKKPTESGIYYQTPDGGWRKMETVVLQGAKSSAGFMTAHAVHVYVGAESPCQITDRRPVFYLRDPDPIPPPVAVSPAYGLPTVTVRDMMIVGLDKKKDHRELTYAGGSVFGFQSGVMKTKVEATLTPIDGGGYTLRPNAELKLGEYLLLGGGPMSLSGSGYDFGIK